MKITLTDAGKRFNRDWIFRHLNFEFVEGVSYAITGPNGSGKSTLLQIISGAMAGSEGRIEYQLEERILPADEVYKHLSITAPYLELIEEMTVVEFLRFHQSFKPFRASPDLGQIISIVGLNHAANKQIRYYSSGMKQRVKLAQTIFSDVPVILLDEPCTNLDLEGVDLYHRLIEDYCRGRLLIVSSNDLQEYKFCEKKIDMMQLR
jgi:ABC-type multidrug transport system ATPase subunit